MVRWLKGRKVLVLGAACLVAVAVPLVVSAATGTEGGMLDRQTAKWTTTNVTTSSTQWRNVPNLGRTRCTRNQVTALLSATVEGGPVRFRVVVDGVPEAPMKPGSARFVPNGVESFSYAFVGHTAPFEADDTHRFNVQWRSTSGAPVTLRDGALTLLFQNGTQGCP
jgi:hypothetical protein